MNVDPATNMVAFQLARGEGENVVADGPTQADDCVQQAWERVAREYHARPNEVVAIYTEWQASEKDYRFIGETFPNAELSHSFDRPTDGDWGPAFLAARQVLEQAEQQSLAQETADRAQQVTESGELLPVLWSAGSSNAPVMLSAMPHWPLAPGRLFVALAVVGPTPRGTIGMNHLTHDGHQRMQAPPLGELFGQAAGALRQGLRIDSRGSERGELLTMHREGGLAASAVALPDFHQRMSELLRDERLIVGLPCPDDLIVAGAGSGWPDPIREMVLTSPYPATELVPSLLLMDRAGIQVLAERGQ